MLGIPLKTDKYTREKVMLTYARILVEMPLEGNFPDYIEFANEKNVLIRQKVIYESLPLNCFQCRECLSIYRRIVGKRHNKK